MTKRKILVLEPFRKTQLDRMTACAGDDFDVVQLPAHLASDSDSAPFRAALYQAEIVVGQPPMELLQNPAENCPNLRFIQMSWAGTDVYTRSSLPFPKDRMALANASGAFGMIISQFVVGQILSLFLNLPDYHLQQQGKIWQRISSVKSLENARVLVFGAGDIGSSVAKRLSGFNAYTVGVCRNTSVPRKYFNELCTLAEAESFLSSADAVVCCIPNSHETAGYMDGRRLNLMKPGSVLVNVGRGNFVDCLALDDVLRKGLLRGAALDVTDPEPLPVDHPLWTNPRCLITPHASGVGFGHLVETEYLICDIVCENISRYRSGRDLVNRIF